MVVDPMPRSRGGRVPGRGRTRAARLGAATLSAAVAGLFTLGLPVTPAGAAESGPSTPAGLGYDALNDKGSLSLITRAVGAQDMWNAGYTGKGVDVAVIDTGVTKVAGLNTPGKVVDGPDLSFDSQSEQFTYLDSYGHGTHMASIIAGSDVAPNSPGGAACPACLGASAYTDTTKFVGVAPESRVVNVKVGATDGATDVSQVIAAIDWVVQHRNDAGMNIRVLNLSFGTDSTQSWQIDPLSFAVDNAWRHGIVVVVAAGNDDKTSGNTPLAMPAANPHVLAVGAVDSNGTVATSDDEVPDFSHHAAGDRTVDVAAPGVSVIGLRVPGGFVDSSIDTGKVGDRFQRGSGTSQATAVVSGLAALLVERYPDASPDQIKQFLIRQGSRLDRSLPGNQWPGSGRVEANVASAALASTELPDGHDNSGKGRGQVALGTGSLDASRGTSRLVAADGTILAGEQDIFGRRWNARRWAAASARGNAWNGGIWNGSRWTGDGWSGNRWTGSRWTGTDWSGSRWTGSRWTGMTWDGSRWTGDGWDGSRWTGNRWTGSRWSGNRWSDSSWS